MDGRAPQSEGCRDTLKVLVKMFPTQYWYPSIPQNRGGCFLKFVFRYIFLVTTVRRTIMDSSGDYLLHWKVTDNIVYRYLLLPHICNYAIILTQLHHLAHYSSSSLFAHFIPIVPPA